MVGSIYPPYGTHPTFPMDHILRIPVLHVNDVCSLSHSFDPKSKVSRVSLRLLHEQHLAVLACLLVVVTKHLGHPSNRGRQ